VSCNQKKAKKNQKTNNRGIVLQRDNREISGAEQRRGGGCPTFKIGSDAQGDDWGLPLTASTRWKNSFATVKKTGEGTKIGNAIRCVVAHEKKGKKQTIAKMASSFRENNKWVICKWPENKNREA